MRSINPSREEEKSNPKRRWLPVPKSRAMVRDILHFEREVPTFPHRREFDLTSVVDVRESRNPRISWTVLVIKAFALVARESPVLRQSWVKYPWPRLYQSPHSVGYLPVKRTHEDEEWLCFAPFSRPESKSLEELQNRLSSYRTEPITEVFRTQYRSAFLPTPVRRLIIASWFRFFGKRRVKRMGTFGITTISSRGAEIQHPPGVHTTTLTYGPINESGRCKVTMHYDHRLLDGWYVAEVLEQLEEVL
ncbi:MAG: hypothetical protein AAF491_05895, partial [Verrucomicrobiota bacterium]